MITRENYEEIMFLLLEKQYSKEEEEKILNEIQTDPFLSAEWENWNQAVVAEDLSDYFIESDNWSSTYLHDKFPPAKSYRGVFYLVLPLAASLLLFLSVKQLNRMEIPFRPTSTSLYSHSDKSNTVKVGMTTKQNMIATIRTVQNSMRNGSTDSASSPEKMAEILVNDTDTLTTILSLTETPVNALPISTENETKQKYRIIVSTEKATDRQYTDVAPSAVSNKKVDLGNLLTDTDLFLEFDQTSKTPLIHIRGTRNTNYSLVLQKGIK